MDKLNKDAVVATAEEFVQWIAKDHSYVQPWEMDDMHMLRKLMKFAVRAGRKGNEVRLLALLDKAQEIVLRVGRDNGQIGLFSSTGPWGVFHSKLDDMRTAMTAVCPVRVGSVLENFCDGREAPVVVVDVHPTWCGFVVTMSQAYTATDNKRKAETWAQYLGWSSYRCKEARLHSKVVRY